jgi:hypothetical protein
MTQALACRPVCVTEATLFSQPYLLNGTPSHLFTRLMWIWPRFVRNGSQFNLHVYHAR